MPGNPQPYGHLELARYEARKRLARGRRTRGDEDLVHTTSTYFLLSTFERVYEGHRITQQQLGAAGSTVWPLELLLKPQFPNTYQLPSRDHFISKALEAQDKSHESQPADRDRGSQDCQDDLTQQPHITITDHLPSRATTRSHRRQGSDGGFPPPERRAAVRSFNRYGLLMTIREINDGIKRLLLRYSPATEGYVYGFMHPNDMMFRTSTGLTQQAHFIKIGRSVDYERRMREFRRNCKYVPHVIFAHFMPHHFRIELVVHLQLHNARLRDAGCTGCGARHEEWFHVDIEYAERLVSLWQAFANCQPYDEEGYMLPMWRERLEIVDIDDVDCWERFIRGIPPGYPAVGYPQDLEEYPNSPMEYDVDPSSDEQTQTND